MTPRVHKSKGGFSYLEILVSLGILAMMLVPLTQGFFHLTNTQIRSYETYQQVTLLNSLMVELVHHIEHTAPATFHQHDLDSFVVSSGVDYRTESFRYHLEDFHWSNSFFEGERAYFHIELESHGDFGTLHVLRYSLFVPAPDEDETESLIKNEPIPNS